MAEERNNNEHPVPRRHRRLQASQIVEADLEEESLNVNWLPSGRLLDTDLLSYISVYFSDEQTTMNCRVNSSTTPEIRNGARITWIENSHTGDLIPVARRVLSQDDRIQDQDLEDAEDVDLENGVDSEDEYTHLISPPPPLDNSASADKSNLHLSAAPTAEDDIVATISSYNNVTMLQRGIFLFFQGILAGFAFTTLYMRQSTSNDNSKFLVYYQPNAQEYRRFFYILATISVIGSIDTLLTIINSRSDATAQHFKHSSFHRTHATLRTKYDVFSMVLAFFIALLHSVVFICTLLMTAQDMLIFNMDGYYATGVSSDSSDSSDWVNAALSDSKFKSGLATWDSLDTVRLICSVVAWIGCCVFVWNGLTQLNAKSGELFRMTEIAAAWRRRANELEGEGLQMLNAVELKKLLAIQKVGVDRSEIALSFFEQPEDTTVATVGGRGGTSAGPTNGVGSS